MQGFHFDNSIHVDSVLWTCSLPPLYFQCPLFLLPLSLCCLHIHIWGVLPSSPPLGRYPFLSPLPPCPPQSPSLNGLFLSTFSMPSASYNFLYGEMDPSFPHVPMALFLWMEELHSTLKCIFMSWMICIFQVKYFCPKAINIFYTVRFSVCLKIFHLHKRAWARRIQILARPQLRHLYDDFNFFEPWFLNV